MKLGDRVNYLHTDGKTYDATVVRLRGAYRCDLLADGLPPSETQMIPYLPTADEALAATPPVERFSPIGPPRKPRNWLTYVLAAVGGVVSGGLGSWLAELLSR